MYKGWTWSSKPSYSVYWLDVTKPSSCALHVSSWRPAQTRKLSRSDEKLDPPEPLHTCAIGHYVSLGRRDFFTPVGFLLHFPGSNEMQVVFWVVSVLGPQKTGTTEFSNFSPKDLSPQNRKSSPTKFWRPTRLTGYWISMPTSKKVRKRHVHTKI